MDHNYEKSEMKKMEKHESKKDRSHEPHMAHTLTVGGKMGGKYATREMAEKMGEVMAKHHSVHHGESLPISVATNDLQSGLKGMPNNSAEGMGEMYGKLSKV